MSFNKSLVNDGVTVWVADGWATPTLDYGTRLVEQFTSKGIHVNRKELPEIQGDEPLDSGLHVLSGGSTSVNDTDSWMPAAKALVSRMVQQAKNGDISLLGVCLGSQIIADCLAPGSIISGPVINAGLVDVEWVASEGDSSALEVIPAFHYEQIDPVLAVEAGIDVVASDSVAPVLAYRYGANIAGIQLHPELSATDTFVLLGYNSDTIDSYGGVMSEMTFRSARLAERLSPQLFPLVVNRLLG